ncbi:MAG: HDOD domain-containing protein [Gammaproteobacteria bacterium]|nr:HDOD domain-containing protein [Gammaproteobacteria bacterium]
MDNKNIKKWLELAAKQPVPVLKYTIKELRSLCLREEIPLKEITHVVERDPGLVVHILRSSNNRKQGRLSTEITHVNQAFRLMGTDQLTKLPDALPAVGDVLDEKAKTRLLTTFNRAYHAARFATDWAFIRRDMTPDEVFAAAQLHFLGEMILAIHAPELLDKIEKLRIDDHLASEEAQYLVLGFTLNELTLKIAEKFKFPELVKEGLSAENAKFPRAYGIMLGVQLARNITYEGWYSKHTFELQEQIADWMDISVDEVIARSHTIAAEVAREIPQYDTPPVARLLPLIHEVAPEQINKQGDETEENAAICLIPQLLLLREAVQQITNFSPKDVSSDEFIQHVVAAMHDGVGLNRVVFCLYNEEEKVLQGHILKGAENDPVFNRFQIKLDNSDIFSHLILKPQAVLMNESTRAKFWPLVTSDFQKLIGTNSFIAMSIFINNKPFGLFYADRHTSICQIEERSYSYFKTLCTHATKVLEQLL